MDVPEALSSAPLFIFPGAFAVTSHSGVSLASLHSSYLGEWILQGHHKDKLEVFHPSRFDVP